ncbi:MAG: recombinase family protein [Alistipes sp.]|nr:recombinase family protein [Alistipes sp.]
MEKVVLLARVSTDKQEYRRQINELKGFCEKMNWEIVEIFANKVSGAETIENRTEIVEMMEFVRKNEVTRVVCLEISRLGRNTLEALKVIQILNENKVSLYIKNYSLETLNADGSVNPITSLICTILLEIASMERLTIRERMNSGRTQYIERCRREGIKMGRPSTYKKELDTYKQQYQKEIGLLKKGISLRNVASITGTSVNTIRKIKELCIDTEK